MSTVHSFFFFFNWVVFHSKRIQEFILPFTCWRISGWFPVWRWLRKAFMDRFLWEHKISFHCSQVQWLNYIVVAYMSFSLFLSRYNWHITLCEFKVSSVMIWYTYALKWFPQQRELPHASSRITWSLFCHCCYGKNI